MAIRPRAFTYSPAADATTPDLMGRDGEVARRGLPVFNANPGDTLTITISSTAENVGLYGAFVLVSSSLYGVEASSTAGLNQARSGGPIAIAPAIEAELTAPNYSVTRTFTIASDALTRAGTKVTSRGWHIRVRQSTHVPPLGNFPQATGNFLIKVAGAEQATIDLQPPVTELVLQPRDFVGYSYEGSELRGGRATLITSGQIGPWSIPNAQNHSYFVTRWPGLTKSEHVLPDTIPPASRNAPDQSLLIYAGGSTDFVTEAAGQHVGLTPYNTVAYDVLVRSDAVSLFPDSPMMRLEEWSNGERVAFIELPIRFAGADEEGSVSANNAAQTISAVPPTISVSQATQTTTRTTVVLTRDPVVEDVVLTVTSDNDDIQVSPAELTFTPENWDEPQPIVVTRGPDALDGDRTATVTVTDGADLTIEVPVAFRSNNAGLPTPVPGPRYQINGVLQSTDDPEAVGFEMDMAWAGESAFRDGAWRYLPGSVRPSVLTITPDMVIDVERCQIGPDSQDRINAATMQIAQDAGRTYLPRRMAKLTLADELLLDGHEREIDMGSRAFINNQWQATRTQAVMMRRTRYAALYILRIRPGPSLERYHVHPGDIVTYTDARYNVYGSRCRVIASTINPDLSMTLSLRQESPRVYQDAWEGSATTEFLWTRLFQLPGGIQNFDIGAYSPDDDVANDRLVLVPVHSNTAGPNMVRYTVEGAAAGTLTIPTSNKQRTTQGVDYAPDGRIIASYGRTGDVFFAVFSSGGIFGGFGSRGIIHPANVANIANLATNGDTLAWENGMRIDRATPVYANWSPDAPQSPAVTSLQGIDVSSWAAVGAAPTFRPNGTLLARWGDGSFGVPGPTQPATQFTFQGQGDEHRLGTVRALSCTAEDRLYVIAEVQLVSGTTTTWIYRRANTSSPDETR